MDGALDLPAVGGVAAPGVGIIGAQDFGDPPGLVFDAAGAFDHVGALEPDFIARVEAEEFPHLFLHKVLPLNPQLPGEGEGPGTGLGVYRIVFHLEGLRVTLGIVGDGELHRV